MTIQIINSCNEYSDESDEIVGIQFFYIFVHDRSFLDILTNFNLLHREPSHPFRIWKNEISVIARVGRHFEFLVRARCKLRGLVVRGLKPRLRKSGTRKFLGGSDHSPKIIKWQGMKLLTFFVACLCQLGGTEIRCKEETGSQNAGFVTLMHSVATRWTNGFLLMLQMFWIGVYLWLTAVNVWERSLSIGSLARPPGSAFARRCHADVCRLQLAPRKLFV